MAIEKVDLHLEMRIARLEDLNVQASTVRSELQNLLSSQIIASASTRTDLVGRILELEKRMTALEDHHD